MLDLLLAVSGLYINDTRVLYYNERVPVELVRVIDKNTIRVKDVAGEKHTMDVINLPKEFKEGFILHYQGLTKFRKRIIVKYYE